jgi:ribosomal protein L37AE/L43A
MEEGALRVNTKNIENIASDLQYLGREDLEKLFSIIEKILYPNGADRQQRLKSSHEKRFTGSLICPHCSGTNVIRFGRFKKHQRYKCKACGKTFGDHTWSRKILTALQKRYPEPFEAIIELDETYFLHQITPLSKPVRRKTRSSSPNV